MKTQPCDNLVELLRFFALPVTEMPAYLAEIPLDSSARNYFDTLERNPLKLALETMLMLARCVRLDELGLPESSSLLEELKWSAAQVLEADADDKQWTLKACSLRPPWLLFRRFSKVMLEETGFLGAAPSEPVDRLLVESH